MKSSLMSNSNQSGMSLGMPPESPTSSSTPAVPNGLTGGVNGAPSPASAANGGNGPNAAAGSSTPNHQQLQQQHQRNPSASLGLALSPKMPLGPSSSSSSSTAGGNSGANSTSASYWTQSGGNGSGGSGLASTSTSSLGMLSMSSSSATTSPVIPSSTSNPSLLLDTPPILEDRSSSTVQLSSDRSSGGGNSSLGGSASGESSSLFFGGFLGHLESGAYSDLELVVEKKHYRVHRIIIAHSSEYFRRLLNSDFQEKNQRVVELKYEDCGEVFPIFLKYLYEGRIELNDANALPLLALSDRFIVDKLKAQALTFLDRRISRDTCLAILKQALEYHMEDVQKRCLQIIAKNFHSIYTSDFSFLPLEIIVSLRKCTHPFFSFSLFPMSFLFSFLFFFSVSKVLSCTL